MVELLRGGGPLSEKEVLELPERPVLLSEAQVGNTMVYSQSAQDLREAAGSLGLMGKVMEKMKVMEILMVILRYNDMKK